MATEEVDVLICGSGSAGLCAALWLSRYGIRYKILERSDGPLRMGQADGVQTRTVEVFDSFGIAEDLLKEAYHVLELAFWAPSDDDKGIKRSHYAPDTPPGLSHQPHVILNQARLNALMIEEIKRAGADFPVEYGWEVVGVQVNEAQATDPDAHCVTVDAVSTGIFKSFRAKYVLGCDGAHSTVRKSLGFKMIGDTTDSIWGVMDIYPQTNFPDVRKKAVINSKAGNLMIIPREGDHLVRFYIELPPGTKVADVTLSSLQDRARLIFEPYTMDFAETAWWSAYSIGQRRADYFHQSHRVFLTGDACHTHSPKAGQGMNVSLQDGYNIGWKLGAILTGQAKPALLETYVHEREKTATELIDFDRSWTKLFSTRYRQENGITQDYFAEQFVKASKYTAGQAVHYTENMITSPSNDDQKLASGLVVGERFPSAQVVRFCDANAMQLVKALPADGRWHLVVFAGDLRDEGSARRMQMIADGLESVAKAFTRPGDDIDSLINPVLVLCGERTKMEQEEIPAFFSPVTGKWKMKNLLKVFADDESYNSGHGHAYKAYGVDPILGAIVIVRPDQYIAKTSPVYGFNEIRDFFAQFLVVRS